MATNYIYAKGETGSGTSTDQLAGTSVTKAGPRGIVRAAFYSSLMETTAQLVGRESGLIVIPSGSHPNMTGAVNTYSIGSEQYVFVGQVQPNESLELTTTNSAACDNVIGVQVE